MKHTCNKLWTYTSSNPAVRVPGSWKRSGRVFDGRETCLWILVKSKRGGFLDSDRKRGNVTD